MTVILGIDPGSLKTGFGVINEIHGRYSYIASGVIRIPGQLPLADRLKIIFDGVNEIIEVNQPTEFAIENVFMAKSAGSALKLGQARGAAIVAATCHHLPVAEYEARKVKQSVVGTGAADKLQVQHMVTALLKLNKTPQEDAADALAVALCHGNTRRHMVALTGATQFRRGRMV